MVLFPQTRLDFRVEPELGGRHVLEVVNRRSPTGLLVNAPVFIDEPGDFVFKEEDGFIPVISKLLECGHEGGVMQDDHNHNARPPLTFSVKSTDDSTEIKFDPTGGNQHLAGVFSTLHNKGPQAQEGRSLKRPKNLRRLQYPYAD